MPLAVGSASGASGLGIPPRRRRGVETTIRVHLRWCERGTISYPREGGGGGGGDHVLTASSTTAAVDDGYLRRCRKYGPRVRVRSEEVSPGGWTFILLTRYYHGADERTNAWMMCRVHCWTKSSFRVEMCRVVVRCVDVLLLTGFI